MDYPKISIVTPTFNRADFLEETILSVINQNYPNLEYIIIDGGSTDGTIDIIKKYKDKITYWVSEPDKGMYHAIQKGFDKATGDIFAWLNSDDIYHSQSLLMVAEIFTTLPDVEWLIGTPSLFNRNGQCVKVFPTTKWSKRSFAVGNYKWIQQESTFWRKSLWEKAGSNINTKYKFAADFELWTRFFDYSELHSVNTILAGFRLHHDQLSVINESLYENEVKNIYYSHFAAHRSISEYLIFKLFKIQKYFSDSKYFIRFIGLLIKGLLKKTYKYPETIYFDFSNEKWRHS